MDELSDYLKMNYSKSYITGMEDCNLLLWGVQKENIPKLCTLTIGIEYDPYNLTAETIKKILNNKYKTDAAFNRLVDFGSHFSKSSNIALVIIVYPSLRKKYNTRWEETRTIYNEEKVLFYFTSLSDAKEGSVISGKELRSRIYKYLGKEFSDCGTSKEKNKKLADYFHMWSRDFLSKNLIKFDIDGFIISDDKEKGVLIEIKRSNKPPIPDWKPYSADKPDYELQYSFAKQIDAAFWLLHHEPGQCSDNTIISFFDIIGVDTSKSKNFLICSREHLQLPLKGNNSLDKIINAFI